MGESIKVAVRIRPLVYSEIDRGCATCLDVPILNEPQLTVNRDKNCTFRFNYLFNEDSSQETVYDVAVKSLVEQLYKGYNVTILAYGQTGSGKTHTMGTNYMANNQNLGVIPRAVDDIFYHIKNNMEFEYKVDVSFLELYKEQMYDLLANERAVCEIREGLKGVYIPGLTEVTVTSPEGVINCLKSGSDRRVTGATAMNQHSSRSHAIFTLSIQRQKLDDPDSATTAKFHLVDLAGSERSKKTGAEGDRFKEGCTINSGLLALGNVISALGEGKQVPSYRNSKLTRLLQDSLGGNSYTLMIACISPADYNMLETLNTLRYADRARKIKNKPVVNQDPKMAEISALKKKVHELQLLLAAQGGPVVLSENNQQKDVDQLEMENKRLRQKVRTLMARHNEALNENATIRERLLLFENHNDCIKECIDKMELSVLSSLQNFDNLDMSKHATRALTDLKATFREEFNAIVSELKRGNSEKRCHEQNNDENKQMNGTFLIGDNLPISDVDIDEEDEGIVLQQEQHANKHMELEKEFNELSKNLAMKEEVCDKLALNKQLCEESIKLHKQYVSQIAELESEKIVLQNSIKQLQAANKETEMKAKQSELIKKNTEIATLQKKVAEQAKITKEREKEKDDAEKKAIQLMKEIKLMKQTKVKLVRDMKQESERWRTWRLERERETAKLRQQNRKQESEIVRMQALHTKQQFVSKRKLEEAAAVNKRLKEALSRQKMAQKQQEVTKAGGNKKEQVQELVSREVEVVVSSIQAEHTLQSLIDDRAQLSAQLASERRLTLDAARNAHILQLESDIELRSVQIADLQQKLFATQSQVDENDMKRWEGIGKITPDVRIALSHMCRMTADSVREALDSKGVIAELQMVAEQQEKEINILKENIIKEKEKFEKEMLKYESKYQELMSEFLQKENMSCELDATKLELISQSKKLKNLKHNFDQIAQVALAPPATRRRRSIHREFEDIVASTSNGTLVLDDSNIEGEKDDVTRDPDWRNTPIYKKLRQMKKHARNIPKKRTIFDEVKLACCSCIDDCKGSACSCYKVDNSCDTKCNCDPTKCHYKLLGEPCADAKKPKRK